MPTLLDDLRSICNVFLFFMQNATTPFCSHADDTYAATLCNSTLPACVYSSLPTSPYLYETTLSLHHSMEQYRKQSFILPTPLANLISFQTDLIYNGMASLFSPIHSLISVSNSESYHRVEETKDAVESPVQRVPSPITHGSTPFLKKLGLCFLSAAYMCMALFLVLILATVVGVALVRLWVEEPVSVKEILHFDYTEAHPTAVFLFNGLRSFKGHLKNKHISVPVGHTFFASLVLVMPESDFNRELGVFQVCLSLKIISCACNMLFDVTFNGRRLHFCHVFMYMVLIFKAFPLFLTSSMKCHSN